MLNLLSTTEKKKVLNEYRLRLATVVIFAIGAFIFASLELLTPSYFLSSIKLTSTQEQLAAIEGKYGGVEKEKELTVLIRDINSKILLLLNSGATGTLTPSQVIENILKIKSDSVKITGYSYEAAATQEKIVLAGTAKDRNTLAVFVEALKKEPTFTSVTLPISSYVKSENIKFSIMIERKVLKPTKK